MTTITLPSGNYNLISIPTNIGVSSIEITMTDNVAVVSSPFVPSQMQTMAWPGADAWSINFTLPKMNRQISAPWRGFAAELRGMSNVCQIGDPLCITPQGQALGAPVCNSSSTFNAVGVTSLQTEGWTPNIYGQLLAGDYIQIGYRLYQVCGNVNSDSTGQAAISIWPSLRETPTSGTALQLINCKGLFRLSDNVRTYHADFSLLTQMSFKLTEVR